MENPIEYLNFKTVNGDNSIIPAKDWHKRLTGDLRNAWFRHIAFPGDDHQYDVAMAMQFKKDAAYYCMFKKVKTSRDGDFMGTYVRVPYFKEIDNESLAEALKKIGTYLKDDCMKTPDDPEIKKCVDSVKVNDDTMVPLKECMDETTTNTAYIVGGVNLAGKFVDIQKIIEWGYQSFYREYSVIFFFDKASNIKGKDGECKDLSNGAFRESVVFSVKDLKGLEPCVQVCLPNPDGRYDDKNEEFKEIRTSEKEVDLFFVKKPCKAEKQRISVEIPEVQPIDWKISLTIKVVDKKTSNDLSNPAVKLDGKEVSKRDKDGEYKTSVPEKCSSVHLEIECDGYLNSDEWHPIKDNRIIRVEMEKKSLKHILVCRNGEFCITPLNPNGKLPDDFCPDGYEVEKGNNAKGERRYRCKRDGGIPKKYVVIVAIVGLLVGLAIGWFVPSPFAQSGNVEEENPVKNATESPSQQESDSLKNVGKSEEKDSANVYLEKHDKWNKGEMEKHGPLKGVWNAMNTYDYEKLKEVDGQYHFDCQKWKEIIKAIDEKKYKRGKGCEPLCKDGDYDITVKDGNSANTYLYRIDSAPKNGKAGIKANGKTEGTNADNKLGQQGEKGSTRNVEGAANKNDE